MGGKVLLQTGTQPLARSTDNRRDAPASDHQPLNVLRRRETDSRSSALPCHNVALLGHT